MPLQLSMSSLQPQYPTDPIPSPLSLFPASATSTAHRKQEMSALDLIHLSDTPQSIDDSSNQHSGAKPSYSNKSSRPDGKRKRDIKSPASSVAPSNTTTSKLSYSEYCNLQKKKRKNNVYGIFKSSTDDVNAIIDAGTQQNPTSFRRPVSITIVINKQRHIIASTGHQHASIVQSHNRITGIAVCVRYASYSSKQCINPLPVGARVNFLYADDLSPVKLRERESLACMHDASDGLVTTSTSFILENIHMNKCLKLETDVEEVIRDNFNNSNSSDNMDIKVFPTSESLPNAVSSLHRSTQMFTFRSTITSGRHDHRSFLFSIDMTFQDGSTLSGKSLPFTYVANMTRADGAAVVNV